MVHKGKSKAAPQVINLLMDLQERMGLELPGELPFDGWGGRAQADIRAGLEAALAAGIPVPVAVAGSSCGGFASWFAITRHADW